MFMKDIHESNLHAPNRNNKNATIGVRYIFPLSKVQSAEITSVSILRNPDENCRHFRANIRKENLRCTWKELQDEKKKKRQGRKGEERKIQETVRALK